MRYTASILHYPLRIKDTTLGWQSVGVFLPRKKRDIRRDFRAAGFRERQGKGDHTVFSHPLLPKNYAVDGRDGADAERYDERNLRDALHDLEEAKKRQP